MSKPTPVNEIPELVCVPKSALDWLFGEGPDQNGNWFERDAEDKGSFWWRKKLRDMLRSYSTNSAERLASNSAERVTDAMVERAAKAHTPQFERMDPTIQSYARQQMRAALEAAIVGGAA